MIFSLPLSALSSTYVQDLPLVEYKRLCRAYLLRDYFPKLPDNEQIVSILLDSIGIGSDSDLNICKERMSPQFAMEHLFRESSKYYLAIENNAEAISEQHIYKESLERALQTFVFFKANAYSYYNLQEKNLSREETKPLYNPITKEAKYETAKDQHILFSAMLDALDKPALLYLYRLITVDDNAPSLLSYDIEQKFDYWEYLSNRKNNKLKERPKNEPITTLLKLYKDKKSKRVKEASVKLMRRFDGQSFRIQKAILLAFLSGSKNDAKWAASRLKDRWIPSLEKDVMDCCLRTRVKSLSILAVRNCSTLLVEKNQENLAECAGYDQVCVRLGGNAGFRIDESKLTAPEYLYVMAKLGKQVEPMVAEKKVFSYLLGLKPQDIFVRPMMELSLNSDWSLMVWALGRLGMGELLVKLFILEEQARLKATSMKSLDYEFCFINALKQFIQKGDVEAPISIAPPVTPIETNTDSVYQDDLPMDYPTALRKEMKVVWSLDYQSGRKYILNLNADVLKIIAVSVPVPLYDINTQWQNFIEHYRLTPYLNYTILSTAQVYVGEEYYIAIIRLYIEKGRRLLFAEKEELALRQKFAEASGRPFVFIEYQEPDYGFDY